jgi:hypothetical protein
LKTWISDGGKQLSLLFPLVNKQPALVIDLSKLGSSGQATLVPLEQFKACTANLH